MSQFFTVTIYTAILLFTISCSEGKKKEYAFFVAGHVYGSPGKDNPGVHPPFKNMFEELKSDDKIEFGVFTGDIVKDCTEQDLDDIDSDLEDLGIPVYFAVGNHDVKDRPLFEKRYGRTYFSFIRHCDLFIVLDGNYHGWNIEGEQLRLLKATIETMSDIDNIFLFVHQIIWWGGGVRNTLI